MDPHTLGKEQFRGYVHLGPDASLTGRLPRSCRVWLPYRMVVASPPRAARYPREVLWDLRRYIKITRRGSHPRALGVTVRSQRISRGASSARTQARSRRPQTHSLRESSSTTHRRISSARTGKNALL